jgi:uncharacterized protein (TIGR03000 family)
VSPGFRGVGRYYGAAWWWRYPRDSWWYWGYPRYVYLYPGAYMDMYDFLPSEDYVPEPDYALPPPTVGPSPAAQPVAARVEVILPDPAAEVSFNGQKIEGKGANRRLLTPPLQPGQYYHYRVTATWTQDGKAVTEERMVDVSAGQPSVVDFTQPAAKGVAPPEK